LRKTKSNNMKYILGFSVLAFLAYGCSSLKTAGTQNYDDAYFTVSDIDKSPVYGKTNPNLFNSRANVQPVRNTRSYGQSYNDRLRNFGSGPMQPGFTSPFMYAPPTAALMYGYSMYPWSFYNFGNPMYYGFNPYGMGYMGYDPFFGYSGYYNPQWCYWNQYYSPYYNYYPVFPTSGNTWGGSTWGGSKTSSSYTSKGTPRSSHNTALPAGSQRSRTGYSGQSSGSGSNQPSSGDYYRPSSGNSSSGSTPTYSRPSSSGPTNATGGGQSGSSGRKR
jgi:hypothetical protein